MASSDLAERRLVRRVVMAVCGFALLTVPLLHTLVETTESWVAITHMVVLGGAFAGLGRGRLRTTHVVPAAAALLWLATVISVSLTARGLLRGDEAVGLGTGLLWLAAAMAPAVFLVLPLRTALRATGAALVAALAVVTAAVGGRVDVVLRHDGVWQVLTSVVVVLAATAAVAWIAGRSAEERRLALLLRQERAARVARLEEDQRRRASLFNEAASALQRPMRDLREVAEEVQDAPPAPAAATSMLLARLERHANELLDLVVEHIDGIVEQIAAGDRPRQVDPAPQAETDDAAPAAGTATALALVVICGVALDALRTFQLAADGMPDPHAVAAGANRMIVLTFVATALLVVWLPNRTGWALSGAVLLLHPLAVVLVDAELQAAFLVPYVSSWRVALVAAALLALLSVVIQRRLEDRDALQAAAAQEAARSDELQRRVEAADRAHAEAAHELKSPLAVIQGTARTLRQRHERLDEERAAQLRTALARAVARLDDRLAVMRGATDAPTQLATTSVTTRPRAAADVLLDALAMAREVLADHPLDVDVRVTGAWTSAAPEAVVQVIENLLSNAHKYGDADGPVRLSAHRESSEIVVEVASRGGDLTRADAARVFEPYWRAAGAADRAQGTGLGLALVARLVQSWGGRTWARVGGGWTRVGFTMPLAESVQSATWQELQDQLG